MSSPFLLSFFLLLLQNICSINGDQRQCQSITYYECKNIGYNQTYLPNKFNHQDQKDVALVVSRVATDVFDSYKRNEEPTIWFRHFHIINQG